MAKSLWAHDCVCFLDILLQIYPLDPNLSIAYISNTSAANITILVNTSTPAHATEMHSSIGEVCAVKGRKATSLDGNIYHVLHTTLSQLNMGVGNCMRLLFIDYSLAFNPIVPSFFYSWNENGELNIHRQGKFSPLTTINLCWIICKVE